MSKKLISIVLSCVLVAALAVVGVIGVSAAVDTDGRYVPSEGVTETRRIYFAMPESWKNSNFKADTAGAYWWTGKDACGAADGSTVGPDWPGYKMQVLDADANLYYVDLPSDVAGIVFNNFLNGGLRTVDPETGDVSYQFGEEQFKAAKQTRDVSSELYSSGDNQFFDDLDNGEFWSKAEDALNGSDKSYLGNFADTFFEDPDWGISINFDNMIFVLDLNDVNVNELSGKETYGGEYRFFYGLNEETGKYEYGDLPNYDQAKAAGLVQTIDKNATPATPDELDDSQPTTNGNNNNNNNNNNNTVPTPAQNATSAANAVSTSDTASNSSDNSAVQTGATTAAAVLAVLLVAGGAVVYTRKRFE